MTTALPVRGARRVLAPLAAALLLAVPAAPQRAEPSGPWTALPLPALARPPTPAPGLRRLETGRSLLGPRDEPQVLALRPAAALTPAAVLGLLRDEIAARGLGIELHPSAPPLLARGAPAELDVLRGILGELDALGRDLDVVLSVWFAPPDARDFAAVSRREPDHRAVVRSGQSISFGERTAAAFLTSFAVEVAADSGVAVPVLSQAQLGRVLHLRPSRVRGGRAVHLECLLEIGELDPQAPPFDPGTPDLGLLEQPVVRFAQARYSDLVESGAASLFTLGGTAEAWADATVWIRAETRADPQGSADRWRGIDLALLEYRGFELPRPGPGAGLEDAVDLGAPLEFLSEAFPAAQVALAAEPAGRRRPGPVWTPGLLLLPPGSAAFDGARSLVDALEGERLAGTRLSIVRGTLRVDLPTTRAQPVRVLIGRETLRLVDYDSHVAPESWMPVPLVASLFDGLCVQGELQGDGLRGQAWVSRTQRLRELARADVGVGRLQLLERGFQSGPFELAAANPRSSAAGLTLELHSR